MIGILLAAGLSHRYGSQNKLVQSLQTGESIAVQAAKHLITALPTSLAIVRSGHDALIAQLQPIGLNIVTCPADKTEMADSLALAIEAATIFEVAQAGYVIALADMPFIQPATILKIAAAVRAGAQIAVPCYRGQRGHPVGFAARFRQELLEVSGDIGARALIKRHNDALVLIDCDDPGIIADIDTPEDLRRYSRSN